jgi:hypothetical protein
MTAALLSKPDSKRTSKAKRIRPFYFAKGEGNDAALYQSDASTNFQAVKIDLTPLRLAGVAFQLNRAERYLALLRAFDGLMKKAYGDPSNQGIPREVALSWRSARVEIDEIEKDGA